MNMGLDIPLNQSLCRLVASVPVGCQIFEIKTIDLVFYHLVDCTNCQGALHNRLIRFFGVLHFISGTGILNYE